MRFKPFYPTMNAVAALAEYLFTGYLCTSDESRQEQTITNLVCSTFPNLKVRPDQEWYGLHDRNGDLCGLLGFQDIIKGWKCTMTVKMWDAAAWGPDAVREARAILKDVMDRNKLGRINSATADKRVKKMARMIGFAEDGFRAKDFMWDGKLYDRWLLGLERRED